MGDVTAAGMIYPNECVLCSGAADRLAADQAKAAETRVFVAKWPGHCASCNLPIVEGQRIAWREGHRIIHADCVSP